MGEGRARLAGLGALVAVACAWPRAAGAQDRWLRYLGGAAEDSCRDVAFDDAGNLYATGGTKSADFVTTDGTALNPGANGASSGAHDAWIAKFDPDGVLLWATLLGGPGYDRAYAIEVNATGVYVAGRAGAGLPTTPGALQESFAGDSSAEPAYGPQDGFVAHLSEQGQVRWVTYLGGAGREIIRDFALDDTGATYAGMVATAAVPHVTAGSYDDSDNGGLDAVIVKLAPAGDQALWGTYLGGSADDGINPSVRVHPTTFDVFVLAHGDGADFPTTAGAYRSSPGGGSDLTLTGILADGSDLIFSTYLGGSSDEVVETHGLALRDTTLVVACSTASSNLATGAGVVQPAFGGGSVDGVIAVFDTAGAHQDTTYLGGTALDFIEGVGVLADGRIAVMGGTQSPGFPPRSDPASARANTDAWVALLAGDLSAVELGFRAGSTLEDTFRTGAVSAAGTRIAFGGLSRGADFPVTDDSQYRSTGANYDARDAVVGWLALTAPGVTPPADAGSADAGNPSDDAGPDTTAAAGGPSTAGRAGSDAASDAATAPVGGPGQGDSGAVPTSAGGGADAADGGHGVANDDLGCGCRIERRRGASAQLAGLVALALVLVRRRARQRSRLSISTAVAAQP